MASKPSKNTTSASSSKIPAKVQTGIKTSIPKSYNINNSPSLIPKLRTVSSPASPSSSSSPSLSPKSSPKPQSPKSSPSLKKTPSSSSSSSSSLSHSSSPSIKRVSSIPSKGPSLSSSRSTPPPTSNNTNNNNAPTMSKSLSGLKQSIITTNKSGSITVNSMLPDELLLLVFLRIGEVRRLVMAGSVCSRWRSVSEESVLWKALYDAKYPNKDSPSTNDWKSHFIKKSTTKFTGKLKRASITNTSESAKLLQIEVPQKEMTFVFTTSLKCSSIPHLLLKDMKQLDLMVGTPLINNGKQKTLASLVIKKDSLTSVYTTEKAPINLYRLKIEGYDFLFGVFPGDKEIGFIHITCFHLHLFHSLLPPSSLVQKPLPSHHKPAFDDLERDYGLRNYELSIVIRSSGKVKWTSYFAKVDFESTEQKKYIRFLVLDGTKKPHMAHSFEGNYGLPWKTDTFSNTVPNMAIVDWMLIDGSGCPIWLESAPVFLVPSGSLPESSLTPMATIYDLPEGEISEFRFENSTKGRVEIRSFFSDRQNRTTLWEFVFILNASFVNNWFLTSY